MAIHNKVSSDKPAVAKSLHGDLETKTEDSTEIYQLKDPPNEETKINEKNHSGEKSTSLSVTSFLDRMRQKKKASGLIADIDEERAKEIYKECSRNVELASEIYWDEEKCNAGGNLSDASSSLYDAQAKKRHQLEPKPIPLNYSVFSLHDKGENSLNNHGVKSRAQARVLSNENKSDQKKISQNKSSTPMEIRPVPPSFSTGNCGAPTRYPPKIERILNGSIDEVGGAPSATPNNYPDGNNYGMHYSHSDAAQEIIPTAIVSVQVDAPSSENSHVPTENKQNRERRTSSCPRVSLCHVIWSVLLCISVVAGVYFGISNSSNPTQKVDDSKDLPIIEATISSQPIPNPTQQAMYVEVTSESCEAHSFVTITDANNCAEAASYVGRTVVWGPAGGWNDVIDGCSARFDRDSTDLFFNNAGICDPTSAIGEWTFTGCLCTEGQPCLCFAHD